MTDPIQEELSIMTERSHDEVMLTQEVLERPVRELCDRPVETLDVEATVGDALDLMRKHRFGAVVVTDNGKLAGIFTERDVLLRHIDPDPSRPIRALMTPDPEWLMLDDSIVYVMNKMHVGGFRHIPIVDENMVPIHIVSVRDVLRYLLDEMGSGVLTIPPDPYRGKPRVGSG